MRRVYLDSSAVVKLIVDETESNLLADEVESWDTDGIHVVISELVVTELRRGAHRAGWPSVAIDAVVSSFDVLDLTRSALRVAGQLGGAHLRTLDAIHIAIALEADADAMVTYDRRQASAAVLADLAVLEPGRS